MIFVTVGTHEQSFDRLLKYIDEMVEKKIINEEVIVQKGYTNYTMKNCKEFDLIGYDEMQKYINEARIVITHGGPASFMAPISVGKTPVVVPRRKKYNEHVNDHQYEFAKKVEERFSNIIVIDNVNELDEVIKNYDKFNRCKNADNNNIKFNEQLSKLIYKMFEGDVN